MRKQLQRCIVAGRAWQKRWRNEKQLAAATAARRNFAKQPQAPGLLLTSKGDSASRVSSFANDWREICGTCPPPRPQEPGQPAAPPGWDILLDEMAAASFPGASTFGLGEFLGIIRGLPKGKAGADDGVLAEFMTALAPDVKTSLVKMLKDQMEGLKAYDTVAHEAIDHLFRKRDMPVWLQAA